MPEQNIIKISQLDPVSNITETDFFAISRGTKSNKISAGDYLKIEHLLDTNINSIANNHILIYNSATSDWENKDLGSSLDTFYVNKTGDSMTGSLSIENSSNLSVEGDSSVSGDTILHKLRFWQGVEISEISNDSGFTSSDDESIATTLAIKDYVDGKVDILSLSSLTDVELLDETEGEALVYSGGTWKNKYMDLQNVLDAGSEAQIDLFKIDLYGGTLPGSTTGSFILEEGTSLYPNSLKTQNIRYIEFMNSHFYIENQSGSIFELDNNISIYSKNSFDISADITGTILLNVDSVSLGIDSNGVSVTGDLTLNGSFYTDDIYVKNIYSSDSQDININITSGYKLNLGNIDNSINFNIYNSNSSIQTNSILYLESESTFNITSINSSVNVNSEYDIYLGCSNGLLDIFSHGVQINTPYFYIRDNNFSSNTNGVKIFQWESDNTTIRSWNQLELNSLNSGTKVNGEYFEIGRDFSTWGYFYESNFEYKSTEQIKLFNDYGKQFFANSDELKIENNNDKIILGESFGIEKVDILSNGRIEINGSQEVEIISSQNIRFNFDDIVIDPTIITFNKPTNLDLGSLSGISLNSLTSDQVLVYNGVNWVNSGISSTADLSDYYTKTETNNNFLSGNTTLSNIIEGTKSGDTLIWENDQWTTKNYILPESGTTVFNQGTTTNYTVADITEYKSVIIDYSLWRSNSDVQTGRIYIVHNGTTTSNLSSEFINTNGNFITFSTDITGNDLRLIGDVISGTDVTMKYNITRL